MTETRDTFSKYYEDNIKKFYIKYTRIIKGPYNQQWVKKTFFHLLRVIFKCYEFLNRVKGVKI
jgi:hypothetical protein